MKKTILILFCFVILISAVACNKTSGDDKVKEQQTHFNQNHESTIEDAQYATGESKDYTEKNKTMSEIFNDILQKMYLWNDFIAIYPQYEITAQSKVAINVEVPEYENVVFVFSGDINDSVSEYTMVSVNAAGDVLLPEYFGKSFDQIIADEADFASYVPSDECMQHLYKYEEIYIYREDFYYFIRGFRHSNKLTSEHIAMLRYDEKHKFPC